MRRLLSATFVSLVLILPAACADDAPTGPTDPLFGKRPPAPTQCLTAAQLALSSEIRSEIEALFDDKTEKTAIGKINNIERKLCELHYADALNMAFDFLVFTDSKIPGNFIGDANLAAGDLTSDVFALAGDPNATDGPFVIPPGAFEPTGGIVTFNPADASPENPIVARTENGEAAIVVDNPNAFPPGTGSVTVVLARAPGDVVVQPGAYIPGFQAYEEGYEIISSAQPSATGGGVIVALCVVEPAPAEVVIGHLHETDVTLLVPTDPDPEARGYIDCSGAEATTRGEPVITWNTEKPWLQFARRLLRPVGQLLAPSPLEATTRVAMVEAGRGLGGRTTSLSSNAPVDPTIEVNESVQLTVGTAASWSSADPSVATVDGTGLVTGFGAGTASITADFGLEESLSILITVRPLTCELEGSITSLNSDTAADMEFTNNTGETISVYWLDYLGERVLYTALADGGSYVQPTYLTHPWLLIGDSGTCYGMFVPEGEFTSVAVPLVTEVPVL
ncbi:MAG: Ig-like domain-containing protein [Gemmatimonadota bacterium]